MHEVSTIPPLELRQSVWLNKTLEDVPQLPARFRSKQESRFACAHVNLNLLGQGLRTYEKRLSIARCCVSLCNFAAFLMSGMQDTRGRSWLMTLHPSRVQRLDRHPQKEQCCRMGGFSVCL
eukprot:6487379-Amphidinium_carterae.1